MNVVVDGSRMIIRHLLAAAVWAIARAHRLEIDPGGKECFFESLQPQDKMTVTYEVGGSTGGGHLDIDFYVSGLPVLRLHLIPAGPGLNHASRKSWLIRR